MDDTVLLLLLLARVALLATMLASFDAVSGVVKAAAVRCC
jgi:hypothetical protein